MPEVRRDRALMIIESLREVLYLGPIACGSLTLNFDADGEFQSFEIRSTQRVKKSLDRARPSPA